MRELEAVLDEGVIDGETLVWREGFADWTPLRDVEELGKLHPSTAAVAAQPAGLRLRSTPAAVKRINQDGADGAPLAPLTVRDFIGPGAPSAPGSLGTESEGSGLGSWFRVAPFELQFFLVTFVLAALVGSGLAVVREPAMALLPLMLQGFLGFFVGGVIFRIRTFQAHVGWGIAGLLIGLTDLIFLFNYWDMAKRSVFLMLASATVIAVAVFGPWSGLWLGLE